MHLVTEFCIPRQVIQTEQHLLMTASYKQTQDTFLELHTPDSIKCVHRDPVGIQ